MKAYSDLKSTGLQWAPQIPSSWQVKKSAYLIQANKGENAALLTKEYCESNKGQYPVYSGQTSNSGIMGEIDTFEYDFPKTGVLFSTTVGAKAMTVSHLFGKFSLSQNCLIFYSVSNNLQTRFAYYSFYTVFAFERALIPSHMQASFRMEDLYQYKIPLPSVSEQQKIAQFLDYETAKIDVLIDEQKRLIELLKEKRQAVISHAVTKGLNPDAPMKNSGVEWLGEVPEHWEVKRLKWLFEIKKNIAGGLGYDVLSITQKGIIIKDIESGDGQLAGDYAKYQIVEVGDFAMNQMDLVTGFVDISNYNGVTSPDYRVFNLRELESSEPRFFLRVFQNAYHQRIFFPLGQGAAHLGRWRLPREGFDNFEIAVPPLSEQEEIARFIDSEHEKLGRLTEESRKQVDLLQERRSALISAAVTGKIDVRDWQPPAGSDTVDSNALVQTERHYG